MCSESGTWPRRAVIAAAGLLLRRPRTARRAAVMLRTARMVYGFAEWAAVRAQDLMLEIEDEWS